MPLTAGIGYTAGLIVKPKGEQFRVGAAIEQPINAEVASDDGTATTMVHIPWTAAFGFAYQFGKRPLNPAFVTVSDRVRRNSAGKKPTGDDPKKAERERRRRPRKSSSTNTRRTRLGTCSSAPSSR